MGKHRKLYMFLGQTVLYFVILLGLLYFFSYLGQSQGTFIYNEF
ncbi:teichoic acid D-Ala incorporation-associated protein DltX [Streptococcus oralis]|uniref:D-alanyl-lipoteichoic acid biosynthesis protein n=3 Tax=Streptococcus TaxID=1301 RepID=A0A1X1IXU9_STROR|nr:MULTISPECIES: teichoic acid D-Ala incorporation-associated protein DltX [Streptococcus]EBN0316589.1 teichoic acid D-Ala incorporation-associated protein DltX [Salmonella enterica subsp. enterica serovar Typhi]ECH9299690.1 teichoic acid D-Ala incorporation-associated protein DltX [Salmonella enterica subsp. enterica serovar Paratyphi A]MDU7194233.1 teichoic acid D-Ala incorporation-associated protein DltX [Streptococcus sp.]MBZ2085851.1 teichoic acid D-Ala incorporation-associated protein Dlt